MRKLQAWGGAAALLAALLLGGCAAGQQYMPKEKSGQEATILCFCKRVVI